MLLAHKTPPNGLFALQFLELKPLGHAVYLYFLNPYTIPKNPRTQQPGFTLAVGLYRILENQNLEFKPSAGFKPAPFLLEARHSFRLSYEGMGIWARIKLATSGFADQRSVH